jgi:D-glucosaminate-6-phosphate ammonia-lyase
LQHQDQDVRLETWHGAPLVAEGVLPGPPHHGIGRALKVGKEEIAGLLAALRAYALRDHAADLRRWTADAQQVVDAVAELPGVRAHVLAPDDVERAWPVAEVLLGDAAQAYAAVRELAGRDPSIALDEAVAWRGVVRVTPTHLREGEAAAVAAALEEALGRLDLRRADEQRKDSAG